MRMLGIAGSLRRGSYNRLLLRAAGEELPPDVELLEWDGLKAVPPFDADDEAGPAPPAVADLRAAMAAADAVLVATPEYNLSVPGQLKNAIDWVSRPIRTNPLRGKPVAVLGASDGMFGAVFGQAEMRKTIGRLGARVLDRELPVPYADEQFDEHGRLLNDELRNELRAFLAAFVAEARGLDDGVPAGPAATAREVEPAAA